MKQINATNSVQLKRKNTADEKTLKSSLKIVLDNIKHAYLQQALTRHV